MVRTYAENNLKSRKCWVCCSKGKAQSPECIPQYCQKKRRKEREKEREKERKKERKKSTY
jgi:hypothetical protein